MEKLCSTFLCCVAHAGLSLCYGGAILFGNCSCAITILILTLLSFVRVHCRSDRGHLMPPALCLLLHSQSCRNMGNSTNKGHFVCGNRCSGGFSQMENQKLTRWRLVCTIFCIKWYHAFVNPHANSLMRFCDPVFVADPVVQLLVFLSHANECYVTSV